MIILNQFTGYSRQIHIGGGHKQSVLVIDPDSFPSHQVYYSFPGLLRNL